MAAGSQAPEVVLCAARQAHHRLLINSLIRRGFPVTLNTSTPPSRLKNFLPEMKTRFVPAPVTLVNAVARVFAPQWMNDLDGVLFDWIASKRLGDAKIVIGAASSGLATGKAAKRRGARFLLDRACPEIRVQQAQSQEEARKLGGKFDTMPGWSIERQIGEYEEADLILAPSNFSRNSYPEALKQKTMVMPLIGRAPVAAARPTRTDDVFTVGVVGGSPLRKGYIYLLEAWKRLALPNARLLIRSSGDLKQYPVLEKLLAELSNVEIVGYVPNLSDFYHRCDVFVLPSVDEGFGMALFEAMAHGLPCIATRNCGAAELLVEGRDALIIDAYSPEQIMESLERLYRDADLRAQIGEAGRVHLESMRLGDSSVPFEAGVDKIVERVMGMGFGA